MKNRILIKLIFLFFTLFGFFNLHGQSISGTVHNLSVNGPGTVKATTESEICIFCHTPHNSSPVTPLWNRNDPGQTYILYSSSTIQATLGQPDGSSILCLSCHDGTIALGNVVSRSADIDFSSGVTTMPVGTSNLSTDLSDDHPISFIYNPTLATNDVQLKHPNDINWPVELENDKVQCTSCHDPHKNNYTSFLKSSSQYSDLCLSCHDRTYWVNSSHNTSTATYTGSNPWFHTPYTTVSENACENCHNPHNANGSKRLMKYDKEENNCFDCHNGNVAAANKNIQTEINKTYSHKVDSYDQIHDPNEDVEMQDIHVECEDCHNPHAARIISPTPSAPFVQGSNVGVRGIDQSGNEVNPAIYEYEICYRCHAEPATFPVTGNTDRVIDNDNVRLDFDTGNPSHHAVVGIGENTDVPSLISPLTESSIIYCTDCHASDDAGGANGPHGSIYPSMLKLRYETADNTVESSANYALCYSCHSRSSILDEVTSFIYHKKHIVDVRTPCNACHDPHGVSGGTITNNSHLINFDESIVNGMGVMDIKEFVDQGTNHGYCQLRCHGKGHGTGMSY